MGQLKRTRYILFRLQGTREFDLAALFRGDLVLTPGPSEVSAVAILTGRSEWLTREEFDLLARVPDDHWIDDRDVEVDVAKARSLAERGLLLSDDESDLLTKLRTRDAQLEDGHWNLYAAAYHFMTQWEGVQLQGPDVTSDESIEEWHRRHSEAQRAFVTQYGSSPGPFHTPRPDAPVVGVPRISRSDGLYDVLSRRKTTRSFDGNVAMRREDLATVLQYVFGAQGFAEGPLGLLIKRTSPSGGARHPVEAYPLISQVEGVDPGFYHYDVQRHALTLLSPRSAEEVRSTATSFMSGQSYFGVAHVSFVLTARFPRTFWKYRGHDKAYAAVLMDAAHLSQTLYLVAAELGLGAFVTVAVNSRDIEGALGLDGGTEGVIAITGCGPRSATSSPLEPRFGPAESSDRSRGS